MSYYEQSLYEPTEGIILISMFVSVLRVLDLESWSTVQGPEANYKGEEELDEETKTYRAVGTMVLILDGNSEIDAHM